MFVLLFLLYRVELKVACISSGVGILTSSVPNVPCGVERWVSPPAVIGRLHVPNVPCGVESH
jgi:hypothetical protein